jgi:hypothetical protein
MLSEIKCGLSALGALMFWRAHHALRMASASRAQGGERISRSGWRAHLALRMASASRAQGGERITRSGWRAHHALRMASASRAQGGERITRSGWRAHHALTINYCFLLLLLALLKICDYILFCSQSTTLLRLGLTDCRHNGCTHKVRPPRPRNDSTQARLLRFGHPKGFYSVARLSNSLWH